MYIFYLLYKFNCQRIYKLVRSNTVRTQFNRLYIFVLLYIYRLYVVDMELVIVIPAIVRKVMAENYVKNVW